VLGLDLSITSITSIAARQLSADAHGGRDGDLDEFQSLCVGCRRSRVTWEPTTRTPCAS
jgi:hypothetical protein